MARIGDRSRSLAEIEGVAWPVPAADATRLVTTAHALRRVPIGELGPEGLRLLISQDIGLPHLLPLALELLRADPMIAGDLYEGDLLNAVLTRHASTWGQAPQAAAELRAIVAELVDLPVGLRDGVDAFVATGP